MNGSMIQALSKMQQIKDLPEWVERREEYFLTIIPPGELFSKAVLEVTEKKVILLHLDGMMAEDGRDMYTSENQEWDEIIRKIADAEPTLILF